VNGKRRSRRRKKKKKKGKKLHPLEDEKDEATRDT
jgi:hypothetical protein